MSALERSPVVPGRRDVAKVIADEARLAEGQTEADRFQVRRRRDGTTYVASDHQTTFNSISKKLFGSDDPRLNVALRSIFADLNIPALRASILRGESKVSRPDDGWLFTPEGIYNFKGYIEGWSTETERSRKAHQKFVEGWDEAVQSREASNMISETADANFKGTQADAVEPHIVLAGRAGRRQEEVKRQKEEKKMLKSGNGSSSTRAQDTAARAAARRSVANALTTQAADTQISHHRTSALTQADLPVRKADALLTLHKMHIEVVADVALSELSYLGAKLKEAVKDLMEKDAADQEAYLDTTYAGPATAMVVTNAFITKAQNQRLVFEAAVMSGMLGKLSVSTRLLSMETSFDSQDRRRPLFIELLNEELNALSELKEIRRSFDEQYHGLMKQLKLSRAECDSLNAHDLCRLRPAGDPEELEQQISCILAARNPPPPKVRRSAKSYSKSYSLIDRHWFDYEVQRPTISQEDLDQMRESGNPAVQAWAEAQAASRKVAKKARFVKPKLLVESDQTSRLDETDTTWTPVTPKQVANLNKLWRRVGPQRIPRTTSAGTDWRHINDPVTEVIGTNRQCGSADSDEEEEENDTESSVSKATKGRGRSTRPAPNSSRAPLTSLNLTQHDWMRNATPSVIDAMSRAQRQDLSRVMSQQESGSRYDERTAPHGKPRPMTKEQWDRRRRRMLLEGKMPHLRAPLTYFIDKKQLLRAERDALTRTILESAAQDNFSYDDDTKSLPGDTLPDDGSDESESASIALPVDHPCWIKRRPSLSQLKDDSFKAVMSAVQTLGEDTESAQFEHI